MYAGKGRPFFARLSVKEPLIFTGVQVLFFEPGGGWHGFVEHNENRCRLYR